MDGIDAKGRELRERGVTVFRGVLNAPMLSALREVAARDCDGLAIDRATVQHTLPLNADEPLYRALIGWPPALAMLGWLGFPAPWWIGGAVIPKPSGERARGWHQDWWGWAEADSLAETAPQVGLLYYLHDTTAETGALKVLPGSHRRGGPLHDYYLASKDCHDEPQEGEEPVCVRAGDCVVLDARLMHASYPHSGEHRRDLLTLWYLGAPALLSEPLQAYAQGAQPPLGDALGPLAPAYDGNAEPVRQCCFPVWTPEYQEQAR